MQNSSKNKKIIIIIIVALLLILLCVAFSVIGLLIYRNYLDTQAENQISNQNNVENNQPASSPQVSMQEYSVVSKNLTKDGATYSININYPQVTGLNNSIEQGINKIVLDYVNTTSNNLISDSVADTTAVGAYNLSFNFTVEYKSKNLLSILMKGDEYTGGAHPSPIIVTYNFDMNNGDELTLNEVFASGSSYLNTLSSLSNTMLVDSLGVDDKDFIDGGTTPTVDNFKNFNFTDTGFKITFDAYQVAPYVNGTPDITIKYLDIKGVMNTKITSYLGV